jgi:P27 family predicted phage terminase small subunit
MKPGRKPVPARLRALHGNPSDHYEVIHEPEGVGALWAPPADFDEDQRAEWNYAIEHASPGLLTGTDRNVLAIWCVASVEHMRARSEVRKLGQIVKTVDGNAIQNPYLPIVNKQALIMLRVAADLGFSPASRAALGRGELGHGGTGPSSGSARLAQYLAQKPDKLDA